MRKEQNKEASQPLVSTSSLKGPSAQPKRKKTSHKLAKLISKRRPRNSRRPKISTAAVSQTSSEGHSLFSKQNDNSTEPLSKTSSNLMRFRSFELQDLIPSMVHSDELISDELRQVWGYLGDIGEHLMDLEARFPRPHLNYSVYFGPTQRLRCISLISSHCQKLGLLLETQFLAFDIFHRICTAPEFERYHSALKAAASLYVAAKYEQVCPPRAHLFSSVDPVQQVDPENVIKLEGKILMYLNFNLSFALPVHFAELLILRYGLEGSSRAALLQLCLQGIWSEELWVGGGSLLAMTCMWMVTGPVASWQQGQLEQEIQWRLSLMRGLLPQ